MFTLQKIKKLGLGALLAVAAVSFGFAKPNAPAASGAEVAISALPPEARETDKLIRAGGPFPYEKDGTVFGNRERLLPREARGYYREYTVKTPGARNRGARRIVCGGQVPTKPDACYYTADHYASFARIVN
jgi:ribonuclease T1